MAERIFEMLLGLPPYLVVAILSAMPISEVRGGIPVGLAYYNLPLLPTLLLCITANVVAVIPVILFFNWAAERLDKTPLLGRLVSRLVHRARSKEAIVNKYGVWAITLFVAVPLPITGAWTGATVAAVFGMHFWRALFCMLVGVLIASSIMTALTLGGVQLFSAIELPTQ